MGRRTAIVGVVPIAIASLCTVGLGAKSAAGDAARSGSVDLGRAIAAAPDRKVIVAGLSNGPDEVFALARYTADGRLDRSFGTAGLVLTSFGADAFGGANAVAIGSGGKIVAAGWVVVPPRTGSAFAIARYTRAGKLDRTFGRNGKVVTSFGASAYGVANQRGGRIVVAGAGALVRYTRRGTLDRSFGRDGKVRTRVGAYSTGLAVVIQPDAKIVVAGAGRATRSKTGFAVARYAADGTLDRSFGNRGQVVTQVGEFDTEAVGVVMQADGKLVLAGNAFVDGDAGFALVRYTRDGQLDATFGNEGQVFNGAGSVTSLAIQSDGKLVTAGIGMRRHPSFSLARFLPDGSLDEGFGHGGKLLTQFQRPARPYALVVRGDGKILVAGSYAGRDFVLARYTSGGRLDGSFGSGGKIVTDFGPAWTVNRGAPG